MELSKLLLTPLKNRIGIMRNICIKKYVSCIYVALLLFALPIQASDYKHSVEGSVVDNIWKSHTNLTHPGKYFRPSKVKIMRPTSPK